MVSKEGMYEPSYNLRTLGKRSFVSRPGAAPLAVWLGHEVIGLHKGGFGFLLGQSIFSSTKVSYVSLSLASS